MSKQYIAWPLFLIQIGCAAVFGIGQSLQMLSSTEGLSITWFAAWEIFLLLNLLLAYRAHKAQASLVTFQTLIIYGFYAVMIGLDLGVMLIRDSWSWTRADSLTTAIVVFGVLHVLFVGGYRISDPLIRGWLAVLFKAVPQLVLALSIYKDDGSGLALSAIIAGHVTILCRIGQLTLSIREAGWDKNRTASLVSEIPNELSWVVVTLVWIIA